MTSKLIFLLAIIVLASCSTPKYTYYFDHHNYNTAKRQLVVPNEGSPLAINPQELVASASNERVTLTAPTPTTKAVSSKTYFQMNKIERTALRHHLKKEFKSFAYSSKKSDGGQGAQHTAGWDNDLKLAAIFGAVGITGLLIGGNVFNIIGGIALIIGVVFLVKWLIRQ
ncbi:hypothetical protein BH09BAC3_BH09BAC3_27180 [soil metagenome]